MDPIQVLGSQAIPHHDADKAGPAEIDAFYHRHGLALFTILPRWRARLHAARLWIRDKPDSTADFAPRSQAS